MDLHETSLDNVTALREQFYRCLLVQHILQHVRRHVRQTWKPQRSRGDAARYSFKRTRTTWHKFLDSLSFLCDHRQGGETVTAIVVEKPSLVGSSAIFWIAMNKHSRESLASVSAYSHLAQLMRNLEQIVRHGRSIKATADVLFQSTVEKARHRVNNHRRKLQSLITSAKDRESAPSGSGKLHTGPILAFCRC